MPIDSKVAPVKGHKPAGSFNGPMSVSQDFRPGRSNIKANEFTKVGDADINKHQEAFPTGSGIEKSSNFITDADMGLQKVYKK